MKKLQRLFTENPSYLKRGVQSLINLTGLAESTIVRFRKTGTYKEMKTNYKNKLVSN